MGKMEDYRARRAAAKAARLLKIANEKAAKEREAKALLAERVEEIVSALRHMGGCAHPSQVGDFGATDREIRECVRLKLVIDMVKTVDGHLERQLVIDDANALSGKA